MHIHDYIEMIIPFSAANATVIFDGVRDFLSASRNIFGVILSLIEKIWCVLVDINLCTCMPIFLRILTLQRRRGDDATRW